MNGTYPIQSGPAVINRNWKLILRRQSIVDIKCDTPELQDNSFTEVIVCSQAAKCPSAPVKINISRYYLRGCNIPRLEDADSYFAAVHRALFFGNDKVTIIYKLVSVVNRILGRVFPDIFDRHLVSDETACVIFAVVLNKRRIKPMSKLFGNTIDKRLFDNNWRFGRSGHDECVTRET